MEMADKFLLVLAVVLDVAILFIALYIVFLFWDEN